MIGSSQIPLRQKIFLLLAFVGLLVLFVPFTYALEAKDYPFDEPGDIYWNVIRHSGMDIPCPESDVKAGIRERIENIGVMKESISESDIELYANQCTTQNAFVVKGIEPVGYIKECYDSLNNLLDKNHLLNYSDLAFPYNHWIYHECYTRKYFKERFNPDTIADYDAVFFNDIFTKRDSEFVSFIENKLKYSQGTGTIKIMDENGTVKSISPSSEVTFPPQEELEAHPEKYDLNPTSTEAVNIPSKSLIQIIKEKLGAFFDWFK